MKTICCAGLLLGLMVGEVQGAFAERSRKEIAAEVEQQQPRQVAQQNAQSSPGSAANARGLELFQAKDYPGAIKAFDEAIQLEPRNALIYFNRGYVKANGLKNYGGALVDFDHSIDLDPKNAEAFYERSSVKQQLNFFHGALEDLDEAIKLKPNKADFYFQRGFLKQVKFDNQQGALADFDRAVQLSPDDAFFIVARETTHRNVGDRAGAIADFRKGLAIARQQKNNDLVALAQENLRNLGVNE